MKDKKFWMSLLAGIMAVILLLGLILSLIPVANAAQSSSEIKEQIKQMEKENEQMQAQIDELSKQLKDLNNRQEENISEISLIVEQKSLIDQQVGWLHAQVSNINEQIAAFNVLIADKQEELEEAELRLAELNAKYKERIRAMEEDGSLSYWSVLVEANSFSDLLDRLNMVQEIAAADSRRLQELRNAAQEVEDARAELITDREEMAAAKAELDATQSELLLKGVEAEELLSQLTAKMEELKQEESAYYEMMEQFESEMAELEEAIGKAESAYDAAVYQEYLATMTTAPTVSSSSGKKTGGVVVVDESGIQWVVPCTYKYVSSPFGTRTHPVTGEKGTFHNGVDLATPCKMNKDGTTDSPIYASRSGVVITSTWSSTAGWYVTIDHLDGYRTTYMHMCCKPFVSAGDAVAAGEVIGCIGTTGRSTGYHLHFGVYKDGKSVNPMNYIG